MKTPHRLLLSALGAAFLAACSPSSQTSNTTASETKPKAVAITAIIEHPALDAVRQGIIEGLAEEGFKEGENLKVDFQSAQGNTATAAQIAKKFVGDNPDVIVPIATPSAQSVVAATKTIPVVYSAITDPIAAKIVPDWGPSGTNVTGISDDLPLEPQIALMKEVVPNLKTVGFVYSPGEVNSTVVLDKLKTLLAKDNIELAAVPAARTADVPTAARSLKGRAELIYTALDNNVASAYESLFKTAVENKLPLVAADTNAVTRGAVAALGINYHNVGVKTGHLVARILRGEKPGDIASERVTDLDLYVNPKNAELEGITLPAHLVEQAVKVVE